MFGATSPILGSRGRLEAGADGRLGELHGRARRLAQLLHARAAGDVRVARDALRPLRLAAASDPRFRSIYLGYTELIRGYDNIQASECEPDAATSQCPVFDRLFGSRMIVANAEVRAPLWGLIKGRLTYGPLPIEIARSPTRASPGRRQCSADTAGGIIPGNYYGLCGNDAQRPKLLGGQQSFLTSVGGALRANVFGFLVAQVSLARPFQRPGAGWVWQWSISPGF